MTTLLELRTPIPVEMIEGELPEGMKSSAGRGWCYAWAYTFDGHMQWLVCLDDTREWVWVPQPEIRADANWSMGRR